MLAESGGFEPPVLIRVQRFSRPSRSAAPATLCAQYNRFCGFFTCFSDSRATGVSRNEKAAPLLCGTALMVLFLTLRKYLYIAILVEPPDQHRSRNNKYKKEEQKSSALSRFVLKRIIKLH